MRATFSTARLNSRGGSKHPCGGSLSASKLIPIFTLYLLPYALIKGTDLFRILDSIYAPHPWSVVTITISVLKIDEINVSGLCRVPRTFPLFA